MMKEGRLSGSLPVGWFYPAVALAFTALGMHFRYQCFAGREFWLDEVNQLKSTRGAFLPIWQRLSNGELTCFPGDYVLTWPFVQMFPEWKWGIIFPHIVATLLGFYLLYLIARRYLKTPVAFVIVFFLMTFNQTLIYHAFELRPYAVLPTLTLAAFYFSGILVEHYETLSRRQKFLIGALFVFIVFFHAYGLLITGLCLSYFLLTSGRDQNVIGAVRRLFPFLWKFAVVAAPLFLWYATGNPDFNYAQSVSRGINVFEYLPNPLADFDRFWRSVFNFMLGYKKHGVKLLGYGIWLAFLIPHADRRKHIGFYLLLIILPLLILLNGSLHTGYWFIQRQFVWMMPLYALLVAWSWDSISLFVRGKLCARSCR